MTDDAGGHAGAVLVLLFPGQGSQSPGMLTPWLDLPGAGEAVRRWSDLTGLDLGVLGTTGTAEQVRDTAVAQPLLTTAALLSARALLAETGAAPDAVCGHSIGELPALAVAGVLSDDEVVALAARRGAAMAEAAAARPTGMSAVLGGGPAVRPSSSASRTTSASRGAVRSYPTTSVSFLRR